MRMAVPGAIVWGLCLLATSLAAGELDLDKRFGIALQHLAKGEHAVAREMLTPLKAQYPAEKRLSHALGLAALGLRDLPGARARALEILEDDPRNSLGQDLTAKIGAVEAGEPVHGMIPETSAAVTPVTTGPVWEQRGDECHLVVTAMYETGKGLGLASLELQEGRPAVDPVEEDPPPHRLGLRLPTGTGPEIPFHPPGKLQGVVETWDDGGLKGQPLEGDQTGVRLRLPFLLEALAVRVLDPTGRQVSEIPLGPEELKELVMTFVRPGGHKEGSRVETEGTATGAKQLVIASLASRRVPPTWTPDGRPTGPSARMRLIGELYVFPAMGEVSDERVAKECPYLALPAPAIDPVLFARFDEVAETLEKLLMEPGEKLRTSLKEWLTENAKALEASLWTDIQAWRSPGVPPERKAGRAARAITEARVLRRLRLIADSEAPLSALRPIAAETIFLIGRFRQGS